MIAWLALCAKSDDVLTNSHLLWFPTFLLKICANVFQNSYLQDILTCLNKETV